jgi:hypothetical protein
MVNANEKGVNKMKQMKEFMTIVRRLSIEKQKRLLAYAHSIKKISKTNAVGFPNGIFHRLYMEVMCDV